MPRPMLSTYAPECLLTGRSEILRVQILSAGKIAHGRSPAAPGAGSFAGVAVGSAEGVDAGAVRPTVARVSVSTMGLAGAAVFVATGPSGDSPREPKAHAESTTAAQTMKALNM